MLERTSMILSWSDICYLDQAPPSEVARQNSPCGRANQDGCILAREGPGRVAAPSEGTDDERA